MHLVPAIFTVAIGTIAVTNAIPANLETRQANTCDIQSIPGGQYCNVAGCSTFYSSYVIEFDVSTQTNAVSACQRECLRNPDCQLSYVSTDKKCRLYNRGLDSSTFTPNGANCPGTWNAVSCAKLIGECPLAQGGFENFIKTDSYVDPWSKQGTDSFGSSISLLSTGDGGYSNNPNGFRFTDLSLVNEVGTTTISQFIRTQLGVKYTASYQYNFKGVSTPSGSVPNGYTIKVSYCGKLLNTRSVPSTAKINVWQTVRFSFTAPTTCKDTQRAFKIVAAPKNRPDNPNGYVAHIGLDGVTLAAA